MKININDLSLEELLELNSKIVQRIKTKRSLLNSKAKLSLFSGTKVSFEDNDGNTLEGTVIKTMRKFAKVKVGTSVWRVPMHDLTKEQ